MNQDRKPETCECSLIYELFDGKGNPASAGRAQALIGAETLSLKNEAGPARSMALRDIERIAPGNYSIEILLGGNEKLSLSGLGYRFKDFLRILHQNRNELILFDMLAEEEVLIPGLDAEVEVCEPGGRAILQGKSGIRLYKTSLAILPLLGEIIKVPLGCLQEEIRVENYRLILETDIGEKFIFFKLGGQLDFLKKSLSDALAELAFQTMNYLKELLPQAGPQALAAAVTLLRDGKGAPRNRVEALAPGLWPELEKEICAAEIGESYRYLQSIGKKDKAAFGFKKGLMGSLSGDTLWFLIPVYQADPRAPGNAVALEAGTIRAADETGGESEDPLAGGGGKATYFFRLMGRKEYAQSAASGAPDSRIDEWISRFNRAMLAVNFRREPIYLSAEKLREPAFRHYRYSLARLPELLMLRELFIGRVIHRTPDQWRADVADLLRFNVGSGDDSLRWKKGE